MNPEYYRVYNEMLEQYHFDPRRYPPWFFPRYDRTLDAIANYVEEVSKKNEVVLRPDAKFFLITSFHQMVAVPVTIVRGTQAREEILGLMLDDIQLIISKSPRESQNKHEISGGAVLRTVAEYWGKLKTNAQQVWS